MIEDMKKNITKRQKELLSIIYEYIKDTGYPPTFEEMRERLNVSSNQSIIDLLTKLKKQGTIKRSEALARGIKILKKGYKAINVRPLVPIVGFTSAGDFAEAIEEIDAWMPLSKDTEIISDDVIVTRIIGDSMIGAGIEDGDLILFKKTNEFSSGDIVLVRTPDGTTVKRFISHDKPPYQFLKPENPKYKIILFTDEMQMIGKMIKKL